jgi:D-alanyl-D-alanine dipeptidase
MSCVSKKGVIQSYSSEFGNAKTDLVAINAKEYDVIFDIKYATKDNFAKKEVYKRPIVYVHKDIAPKLKLASERAKEFGYKIKIFDAWRPYEAQITLWNVVQDPDYVSNPYTGPCGHCRGAAIDLTLVDIKTGKDLDMGTPFDSFDEKSHHTTKQISKEVLHNRIMLAGIMSTAGFQSLQTEWWHYQIPDMMNLYPKYKASDLGEDLVYSN